MTKILFIILIISVNTIICDDSIKVYQIEPIIVSASKLSVDAKLLPYSAKIIDTPEINHSNGSNISSVLKNNTLLFVNSYGAVGQLQTISSRGTSADESVVLINGMRLNQIQNGTIDLGLIPIESVERVEILKVGNSSLYGSNAIGSVINVVTKNENTGIKNIAFGMNSFDGNKSGIYISDLIMQYNINIHLQNESGSGEYPFNFNNGNSKYLLSRKGADYKITTLTLSTSNNSEAENKINQFLSLNSSDRGTPGVVTSINNYDLARLKDKSIIYQIALTHEVNQKLETKFNSSFQYSFQNYKNESLKINSTHINRGITLQPEISFILSDNQQMVSGLELFSGSATSTNLESNSLDRMSLYFSFNQKNKIPFILNEIYIYPTIRIDKTKNYSVVSPLIGLNLGNENDNNLRIRATIGKSFREPTMNELYWTPGGNQNLKPEESVNLDFGILYSNISNTTELELNIYSIDIKNRIIWLPTNNGYWSSSNILNVSSQGIELISSLSLIENSLKINYKYSLSQVLKKNKTFGDDITFNKQLPYIPQEISTLGVNYTLGFLSFNIFQQITGFRFTTADNNPNYILPSFKKTDLNILYKYYSDNYIITGKFEIDNLFNENYQIADQFPMPLRNYFLTIQLQTNQIK